MPDRRCLPAVLFVLTLGCSRPSTAPAAEPVASAAESPSGPAVVEGRAPLGAIVTLEPQGSELALPEGPAVLDQYGKAFVPDVLFVRLGQVVEFRNSDDVDHNIRIVRRPTGTMVMDVSGSQHQVFKHTFEQSGAFDVTCDVHPGMRATIVASPTPFATESDNRGAFSLKDVPSGDYLLRIIAEGRETTQPVKVTAPRTEVAVTGR